MDRLSKQDKAVIRAFTEKRALGGNDLDTDGTRLDIVGLGGGSTAVWKSGKIHLNDTGSRSGQLVQRAIAREAPKNDLYNGRGYNPAEEANGRQRNSHDARASAREFQAAVTHADRSASEAAARGEAGDLVGTLDAVIDSAYWLGRASAERRYADGEDLDQSAVADHRRLVQGREQWGEGLAAYVQDVFGVAANPAKNTRYAIVYPDGRYHASGMDQDKTGRARVKGTAQAGMYEKWKPAVEAALMLGDGAEVVRMASHRDKPPTRTRNPARKSKRNRSVKKKAATRRLSKSAPKRRAKKRTSKKAGKRRARSR